MKLGLWLAVLALGVSTCSTLDRGKTADDIARPVGLARSTVRTSSFVLAAFARQRDPNAPLVVYIEGDGLAYVSRSQASRDPTPRTPVGLQLAALDQSPNVLYLARPCQYTLELDSRCNNDQYWTLRRFAEEVVASMNQAIDRFLASGGKGVRLVGFSGGGAVAALIAARRNDVIDLRTVAGNLDHVALNSHHNVSQLSGSLNAADVAQRLAAVPQLHVVGGRDEIVLQQFTESYARRAGDRRCIEIVRVESASHESGWLDVWPGLLRRSVACARN